MPSTYGATPIQPNQNVQTKTGKYVGIGLLCACVLTIGVSMKEDASTFTGMSTKSENKIYKEFSDDGDFTSKRDSFLGMKGVNGCPNGTEPIYDHTECRTQAANLGFSYYEKYTTSSDNSVVCNYCSGCDKLNTPNIIEDGGSTVRVDQSHASRAYWVCKAITAKPTAAPTAEPTTKPTTEPTAKPTTEPTAKPTTEPTTSTECFKPVIVPIDATANCAYPNINNDIANNIAIDDVYSTLGVYTLEACATLIGENPYLLNTCDNMIFTIGRKCYCATNGNGAQLNYCPYVFEQLAYNLYSVHNGVQRNNGACKSGSVVSRTST